MKNLLDHIALVTFSSDLSWMPEWLFDRTAAFCLKRLVPNGKTRLGDLFED
jgi:hypothetical protein